MKELMERAASGNRQAVTELFEKHWKGAKAICSCCFGDADQANVTVVHAFYNTWDYLFNNCIKSEEEFQNTLYKQAAILCRKAFVKKGMKGLAIPQGKNFVIAKWKEEYMAEVNPVDNLLAMFPGINRYIFVLHHIAEFDQDMIASITGYKMDIVEAALKAEEQNTARALEQLSKDMGRTVELKKEILKYQEEADLPENYRQQILSGIDAKVRPYEKKRMLRSGLYIAGAAVLAVVLGIAVFYAGKEPEEITFTEGKSTSVSQENASSEADAESTAEDGPQNDEGQDGETFVFVEGSRYYADITVEDHGTITVELDYEAAPITVENFVSLAEDGFYDGLTFHRIMEGFMMQGGDPKGNGTGGSEETIVGEFSDNGYDNDLSHTRGAISMARSSAYDSASSQFFIVHEDSTFLDGQYAAFGYVAEGMDIVDTICTAAEPTDNNGTIPIEAQPVITSIDIRVE